MRKLLLSVLLCVSVFGCSQSSAGSSSAVVSNSSIQNELLGIWSNLETEKVYYLEVIGFTKDKINDYISKDLNTKTVTVEGTPQQTESYHMVGDDIVLVNDKGLDETKYIYTDDRTEALKNEDYYWIDGDNLVFRKVEFEKVGNNIESAGDYLETLL